MKELVIPIKGMHCRSCEIMVTDQLEKLPEVKRAKVSLKSKTATVYGTHLPPKAALRRAVQAAGYDIDTAAQQPTDAAKPAPLPHRGGAWRDLAVHGLIVIAAALVLGGVGFKVTDLVAYSGTSNALVGLTMGLVAGISTCMALVGGLVLGLSSRYAEKHPEATATQKFRPHLFFNLGRIASFFVLGGVIGSLGSIFQLQGPVLGVLMIGVGIFMLLLGLQLTEAFPRISTGRLTLPSGIARRLGVTKRGEKEYSHKNAFAIGALSFFLPCGFTQVMQLYAISTGSFTAGALIMGAFAIGTAPGLLGIGGLTSIVKGAFARRFFRFAGVVVVAMALYNISNGYNLTGLQARLNLGSIVNGIRLSPSSWGGGPAADVPEANILRTTFTYEDDIIPTDFTAKVGEQYMLEVDAKEDGRGCMSTIMIPGLYDTPIYIKQGEKIQPPFKAEVPGRYLITCAMGVPRGAITVT